MIGQWQKTTPHVSPFGKAMDALHVTASTPNEQLFGEVNGWYDVRISIMPGFAERAGDRETAHQLTQLARVLFAVRQKAYRALVEEHLSPPVGPMSARRRAFRDRQDATTVTGSSADGSVTVTSTGLDSWFVEIVPGSVDRLGSAGLARAATEAANQIVWQWLSSIDDLKRRREEEGW